MKSDKRDKLVRKEYQLLGKEVDEFGKLAKGDSRSLKNYVEKVLRGHLELQKIKNDKIDPNEKA